MEQNNVKTRLSAMNGLSQTDSSTQFLQQQQELASSFGGGGGGGRKIQNMSMQTGEEFSMEFLQDRFSTRGNRLVPNKSSTYDKRGSFDSDISYHMGCEDVARVITLKRMDSDVSTSSMGSPNGSENACFLDKLTWISGEEHHRSRNGFGELNNDRGPSLGSTFYGLESPRGNNMNGHLLNMSDRLQPGKMKLICSSGGKILPRPGDGKLRYVGGETRIISISKSISWIELVRKTSCICSQPHYIKYQLPGEDLDGLISVSSDEDLQNMMEEHYGLENLGGSPRLRIFLIPMGESENLSSFEVTQTYPDYHYVVAVNGIGDPSPRIIPTAGDASTRFNCNPSFCKRVTPSMVPLEINGGLNSFQNMRSPYPSPPISPVPLPGDSLATESSSTSLLTVPLSTDNTGLNSIVFHQTLQGKATLTNCRHICKHVEGGQLEESSIEQYHNFLLNKDLVGLSGNYNFDGCYNERPIQRRHFHSESPISHPKDSRSVVGSTDSSDPPQGIPHAYSDSKLHQHGEQMSTYYCSQEAESPSLELKFSKAHVSPFLSSSPRREKPLQVCETCHTTVRIVDGNNQVPNLSNEASLGLETSSQNDPFVQQSKMSYWEKPPIDCKRKIQIEPISLSGNVSSRIITTPIDGFDTIADFKYPINKLENFTNYQLESAPSDVVMMSEKTASDQLSPLCIKVNIKQEGDISRVKNTEFELLENASLHHNIDSSLHDLVRQPSNNTYYLKGNLVQPVESERDMCSSEHPHTRAVDSFTCILDDNLAPKVNFCENDLHTTPRNVDYEEQIRLLDDEEGKRRAQNVGKLSFGEPTNERSDIEDILLVQTRNSIEEQKRSTLLKPLVVMKDVTSVDPSSILVSCADSSKFTVPTSGGTASATLTELENVIPIPHVRLVVAKQTMPDFVPPTTIKLETVVQEYEFGDTEHNSGNKYGCISDVAVAEMKASIHGLQIIKNSDLEELRELGAGTYGIAYHGKWRGTDVAIKRIKKSCFSGRSSEQEQLTKDFWREAHILSTLHHPNVVAFYGVVPDGAGGTLATVTEFMVNGSLRNALLRKERCLDRRKKLMIAMDAAFGMEYLHSKSIVHFDLKCENLLVNLRDPQRPICKVGDFGLSRIKQNTLVSGGVRGTLPWMAPELLNGSNSQVSEKVDVFAFGMSMWEILTGEEPYADMHCGAIIGGIVKNTLRPPVPEDCDQDWRELMEQCWSLNPDSRPSFTEIANRLRVMSMTLLAKGSRNQTRQSKSSS